MSRAQKAKGADAPEPLTLPADLSPADAPEVREQALARLEAAEGGSDPLKVDLDGDTPTPSALQILVATTKSADRRDISLALAEDVEKVLADLDPNES